MPAILGIYLTIIADGPLWGISTLFLPAHMCNPLFALCFFQTRETSRQEKLLPVNSRADNARPHRSGPTRRRVAPRPPVRPRPSVEGARPLPPLSRRRTELLSRSAERIETETVKEGERSDVILDHSKQERRRVALPDRKRSGV